MTLWNQTCANTVLKRRLISQVSARKSLNHYLNSSLALIIIFFWQLWATSRLTTPLKWRSLLLLVVYEKISTPGTIPLGCTPLAYVCILLVARAIENGSRIIRRSLHVWRTRRIVASSAGTLLLTSLFITVSISLISRLGSNRARPRILQRSVWIRHSPCYNSKILSLLSDSLTFPAS